MTPGIWKHNEALDRWQLVGDPAATPEDYARRLRQSSVLTHTRAFVAWYFIASDGSKRELARGEA